MRSSKNFFYISYLKSNLNSFENNKAKNYFKRKDKFN